MIDTILERAEEEKPLTQGEIVCLLSQEGTAEKEAIFEMARRLRSRYFGNHVFAYGFVYFSTYCRNDCRFCFYRKSNQEPPRYRKSMGEIVAVAKALADSGVHLIDLTMGEDRFFLEHPERLLEVIGAVKEATGLPVMISPGLVEKETVDAFKKAGVSWYALYQETYDRRLYRQMRVGQDFDTRMAIKGYARKKGILIEEGLLTGIGDSTENRAEAMVAMGRLKPSQVRTMTFVPQKGTPLEKMTSHGNTGELLNIAVMRLLYPDKLIPASLDVEGLVGLEDRLMAGANVVTSLIPPLAGLAGVSQSELDIDDGSRSVSGIIPKLEKCGLELAGNAEYEGFIKKEMAVPYENSNDSRWEASGSGSRVSGQKSRISDLSCG